MNEHSTAEWERLRPAPSPAKGRPRHAKNPAFAGRVLTTSSSNLHYVRVEAHAVGGSPVQGGAGSLSGTGRIHIALPIGGNPVLNQPVLVERVDGRWVIDLNGIPDQDDPDNPCDDPPTLCLQAFDGCYLWEEVAITVTGPGGYDETLTTGPAGEFACFTVPSPGTYSATMSAPSSRHAGVTIPVLARVGCWPAYGTLVTPVLPDYVDICCCDPVPPWPQLCQGGSFVQKCKHLPMPKVMNWSAGSLGGTAVYRGPAEPLFPNSWVACVPVNVGVVGPYNNWGGSVCDDEVNSHLGFPFVCATTDEETTGVLWVVIRSCMTMPGNPGYPRSYNWLATVTLPVCPSVGRTCDDDDYFVPTGEEHGCRFNNAPAFYGASFSGYTWSCSPHDLFFSFTPGTDPLRSAVAEDLGSGLRFYE
jgi:hypothetical protein